MTSNKIGMTRDRFLRLASATGAGLALSGAAWVAKAKTVNAQVATTGKLSSYCRGDGSDETAQIQKCFTENLIVEVDEPPAGFGYGFAGRSGIQVRSGQTVTGVGANAKLLRVPGTSGTNSSGAPENYCFINKNRGPIENVKFENLYIAGRGRQDLDNYWDLTNEDDRMSGAAFSIETDSTPASGPILLSRSITLTDVTVVEWPGQSVKSFNIVGWYATRFYSRNSARGAHVLGNVLRDIRISFCESTESGDDSFALNARERDAKAEDAPFAYDFEISDCKTSGRQSKINAGGGNAGIAIRGGRNGSIKRCSVYNTQKDGIALELYPTEGTTYQPKEITVYACEIRKAGLDGIGVNAADTNLISLRSNKIYDPGRYGTSWTTPVNGAVRFGQCEDFNTYVASPGVAKRYIESNISGITVT